MLTSKVKCGVCTVSIHGQTFRSCVCVCDSNAKVELRTDGSVRLRLRSWADDLFASTESQSALDVPFCAAFDNTIFRSYLDAT